MRSNVYPSNVTMEADDIRLVRLLPGAWADPIRCELVYDSLSTVGPYYALSYVWGSQNNGRHIQLNAQPFYVTINLESALRHLRRQLNNTLLWIDALSINQTDDRERTHQVKLMGKIYQSCQSVLVYLGDSTPRCRHKAELAPLRDGPPVITLFDNKHGFCSSERFASDAPSQVDAQRRDDTGSQRIQNIMQVFQFIQDICLADHLVNIPAFASRPEGDLEREDRKSFVRSLRQLMHGPVTPWWGRIWVVQEVILPPEVIVVHGTICAPWSMFSKAATRCSYHLHHCCAKDAEKLPRDILVVLTDFCERVLDIEKMRSVCKAGRTNPGQPNRPLASNVRHDVTERNSLITLLRRFRNRKATDLRDKVYALLSLVEENNDRPPLLPEYRLNDAEVYIRASLESIYSSGPLSVLSVDVARKYRQDMPSWVPDWDAPGDFSHNERIRTINLYNTSSKYPVNSDTVRLSGSELISSGRMIDFVSGVAGAMLSESNDTFRNILSNWIAYIVDNDDSISVVGLLGRKYVLWRLLCAEIVYAANYASDIPRRARASDELMFVTWTLLSRNSPFYDVYRIPGCSTKRA
jgi:hypothetical protein